MFENYSEVQVSDKGTGNVADGKALINELDFAGFKDLKSKGTDSGKGKLPNLDLTDSDSKVMTTKNWEQKPGAKSTDSGAVKGTKVLSDKSANDAKGSDKTIKPQSKNIKDLIDKGVKGGDKNADPKGKLTSKELLMQAAASIKDGKQPMNGVKELPRNFNIKNEAGSSETESNQVEEGRDTEAGDNGKGKLGFEPGEDKSQIKPIVKPADKPVDQTKPGKPAKPDSEVVVKHPDGTAKHYR